MVIGNGGKGCERGKEFRDAATFQEEPYSYGNT